MTRGLAAALADGARRLDYGEIPLPAIACVKAAIIDCIGCILSGMDAEETRPVLQVVAAEGGAPQALIFGTGRHVPATAAALVNGTAAHALDFDDTSPAWFGHPSVSLVPALFAVAQMAGAGGRDLLTSYVAAYEAVAQLGRRMNPGHYLRGWHATGTMGTLGAAIAAGLMLRLDGDRLAAAIGIAASQAAGLRENFGTGVKPLHAGLAARAGVLAALLAQAGMTASPTALEGSSGFMRVYGDAADKDERLPPAAGEFELVRSGISLKLHACCGAIHTSLDAILWLQRENGFSAEDVSAIECTLNQMSASVLIYPEARTPLEGKFSLQYCIAAALIDGACGLAQFAPARLADTRIQALSRRVAMLIDATLPAGITPATVVVRLADGRVLRRQVEKPKGSLQDPMDPQELRRKFLDCAACALDPAAAARLFDRLDAIETVDDIRTLLPLLAGRGAEAQRIDAVS